MSAETDIYFATPIRRLFDETAFPIDFLTGQDGLLAPLLDRLFFTSQASLVTQDSLGFIIELVIDREASVSIPGLSDLALVLGGSTEGFTVVEASVSVGLNGIKADISDIKVALRFPPSVLKPIRTAPGDVAPLHAQIEVQGDVVLNESFEIEIHGFDAMRLPPAMIGNSGVIIEADNVKVDLSRTSTLPELKDAGFDESFLGVFIGEAKVTLPESYPNLAPEDLILRNSAIGSGGVSGILEAHYSPNFDTETNAFTGRGAGKLFDIQFGIKDVILEIKQNAFLESQITGEMLLPFFEKRVSIDAGINLDGSLSVNVSGVVDTDDSLNPDTGLFTLRKDNILSVEIDSIGFEINDDASITKLSGQVTPLFGKEDGLDWPSFEVKELTIDSDGNVHLDGGWLDLREQYSLDFHGFQMEITKLGFGKTEDGGKWIGFSGGLKLVDGLSAGASVEGLRITWYDDDRDTKITFNGIGVEFDVPDVLYFKGSVSYDEANNKFSGAIELDLKALEFTVDGVFVVGTENGQTYMAIYLATELPSGIPLWSTGLALYGCEWSPTSKLTRSGTTRNQVRDGTNVRKSV